MTRASSRLVLPLFIAANSRQYSRDSANNAYVQAMTGEVSPVAQTMKEYVDVLGIVRNAAEETRRRYLASIKQSDSCPTFGSSARRFVEICSKTLCRRKPVRGRIFLKSARAFPLPLPS